MWTQEDGTTLEKGSMENPATGKVEPYEEVWEDPQPERVGDRLRYDCLKLDREEERKKGMIVRVGQYVQGILVEEVEGGGEKKVVVERWKREVSLPVHIERERY